MSRSLVTLTTLLVGGVVLALGAGVLFWITADDLAEARREASEAQHDAEVELRSLARVLLSLSQDTAVALVEGSNEALRRWIAQEPLTLYRDPEEPGRVDVAAIQQMLVDAIGRRNHEEKERIRVLTERMALQGDTRIDAAASKLRALAVARADRAAAEKRGRLAGRFAMLLAGMALLLGGTLFVLVVGPVRRLRDAVNRIAQGDLATPVPPQRRGAQELDALTRDVERMRGQIRAATEGLEDEVRRKTEDLERTLAERTQALEELRTTQDRLVQAAKMAGLGTLAGGVAHEFNNLIGGIRGCIESARSASTDPDMQADLDMARKTSDRAAVLIRALLDVARPGERSFGTVDLVEVVADVVRTAAPTARQREVALEAEAGAPLEVEGDEGQLHQVVLNLVTNALQASPRGSRVRVTTGRRDAQAWVEVLDEGAGVPDELKDRIFEPFFTAREGGTGLGLFVSYGIVERHGGRIEVGAGPAGGARMTVFLPGRGSGPGVASAPA
ncbi:MAG: ATP-binding protein [Planctomycetota bacterium]|nr:ATP-binding protein [Planctomycetota bacterium]